MAAGCSSQVARFNGVDDVFTGATANQRQIINRENQPFPGDTQPAAPAPAVQTESVSRGALEPVTAQPLPPPSASIEPAPVSAPTQTAHVLTPPKPNKAKPLAAPVDDMSTGTVAPRQPAAVAEEKDPKGWSRAGGTQVTAKDGETVFNLSRRFGVPAKVIMQVNGITESDGLKAGQKVIIPTYVYSSNAPVSAPDSDPKVAGAKSSKGNKNDTPSDAPLPQPAPSDKVAVLPQGKKKEEDKSASSDATPNAADGAKAVATPGVYTVQSGDTLSKIAKRTGVSSSALKQANGLEDGYLKIGQKLKVPAGGKAVVAEAPAVDTTATGSTPPKKKATAAAEPASEYTPPKKSEKTIEQAEASDDKAPDATGIGKMRWPVRGRVITSYGKGGGKSADGIDIAVPEGTAVKAAENGVVIYAGDGLKDFGNTVLVRHEDGLVTVYGNASQLKVQRGQKVKRGEEIAVSGMTGNADTPKLHFEVRKNSAPVDPSAFLE